MASILRRFSNSASSNSNSNSNPNQTTTSTSPPTGRIYGARDWQLNATASQPVKAVKEIRKLSVSSSPNESDLSSSVSSTASARVFGARDWRQGSISQGLAAEDAVRRQSIVEDYTASEEDMPLVNGQMPGGRKNSVPYGPRHYLLANKERQGSV